MREEPEDRQQSFKEIVGELTDILPALRQLRSSTPSHPADTQTPAPAPVAAPVAAAAPAPVAAPAAAAAPAAKIPSSSSETIAGDLSRIRAAFAEPPIKPPGAGQMLMRRLTAGLPPNLKTSGPERQSRPAVMTPPVKEPARPEVTPPKAASPAATAPSSTVPAVKLRAATVPVVEKPRIKPATASPVEAKRRQPAKAAVAPGITLGVEPPRERRALIPAAAVLAIVLAGGGFWYFGVRTTPTGPESAPVPKASVAVSTPAPPMEPAPTTPPPTPDPPSQEPKNQATPAVNSQQPAADPTSPPEPVRPTPRPWTDLVPAVAAGRSPSTGIISPEPPAIAPAAAAPAVRMGSLAGQSLALPPPPPNKPPLKIGGRVRSATLKSQRPPAYPVAAKAARIEGIVHLRAHVDERGNVESVRYLDGPRMLAQAALDAVKEWRYEPATLNGATVAVDTEVQVNFTLR